MLTLYYYVAFLDGDISQVTMMCPGEVLRWGHYSADHEHIVPLNRSLSKYNFSDGGHILTITNINRTDEGNYSCLSADNVNIVIYQWCIYIYGEFVSRSHLFSLELII